MNMKLSELIREGSKNTTQCYGQYFERNEDGSLAACVLGAAFLAFTGKVSEFDVTLQNDYELTEALGELSLSQTQLDHLSTLIETDWDFETNQLPNIVVTLNDTCRWSREKIIDWLESEGY